MQATINGITLAFNDQGTGLPLVFLHAFPLNRTMWAKQEEALSSQFRVITIDLRGHGESNAPLLDHPHQAADDVHGLLDHLSIRQAVFIGLSMGGYILFAFYRKYAERVTGLVLADTRAQADTDEGKQARFEMAQIAYTQGARAIADIMIPKLLGPPTIHTVTGASSTRTHNDRGQPSQRHRGGLNGDGGANTIPSPPKTDDLSRPIFSSGNWIFPPPLPTPSLWRSGFLTPRHLTLFQDAAHLSNLEQPGPFNETVGSFVSNITR